MLDLTVNFFLNKFHYLHLGIANPLICFHYLLGLSQACHLLISIPTFGLCWSSFLYSMPILPIWSYAYTTSLHILKTYNIDNDIVLPLGNILAEAENGITWQSWLKSEENHHKRWALRQDFLGRLRSSYIPPLLLW